MEKRISKHFNTEMTIAELETRTTAELVIEYNLNMVATVTAGSLAPGFGKTITKFSNRKSAIRRTWDSMQVAETPVSEPAPVSESTPPAEETVTCHLCGKDVPKKSTFSIARDGKDVWCCKNPATCKVSNLKSKVAEATAEVVKKQSEKKAKVAKVKGQNPNIGKFDNCPLTTKGNGRASATSTRTLVYLYISDNPNTTIKDIVEAGIATLPVVRDCVKKLFADGKIGIDGWMVDVPRTFKFSQVQRCLGSI